MTVLGLDHVAITVADISQTVDFYSRVLGAEEVYADLRRSGKIPVAVMQVGANRINVHAAAAPASPHADTPMPGSADICFRWEGTLDDAAALLSKHGVEVIEGPVPRPAANGVVGASVYFRDPDNNLLEFLSTEPD
ncbi:MAG: catechol 2,3-dioxygenase-like lactoylglutathione lyase family enzyme [Myxococcota bacterium]|jgi:catechol 2,3-dioxygenase-like lactoylglutathione lyase family enzyme